MPRSRCVFALNRGLLCFGSVGCMRFTTDRFILSTTILDICAIFTALLGIEFAGSGLYQGQCNAGARVGASTTVTIV